MIPASTFLSYGFSIFLTALIGGLLPLTMPKSAESRLKIFVSFGAGLLLGMAFLHMIPESSKLVPETFGLWLLCGFLLLLLLERFVMVHACEEGGCDYHTVGVAAFAGLTVHGMIEGFALTSSLFVSEIGPLVLLAILAHKAPAGFALTSILKLAGKEKGQIVLFTLGVSASAPLGVLLAYAMLSLREMSTTAGVLLSISSGTFLYIAACDLLPELHKSDRDKIKRLTAFLLGLVVSGISSLIVEHSSH